jgi:hypothetical protein
MNSAAEQIAIGSSSETSFGLPRHATGIGQILAAAPAGNTGAFALFWTRSRRRISLGFVDAERVFDLLQRSHSASPLYKERAQLGSFLKLIVHIDQIIRAHERFDFSRPDRGACIARGDGRSAGDKAGHSTRGCRSIARFALLPFRTGLARAYPANFIDTTTQPKLKPRYAQSPSLTLTATNLCSSGGCPADEAQTSSLLRNPDLAPSLRSNCPLDRLTGTRRLKNIAICAALGALRTILIANRRLRHLSGRAGGKG